MSDQESLQAAAARLRFGRLASPALLVAFRDGPFACVTETVRSGQPMWDLRFRSDPGADESVAALYCYGYGALLVRERGGRVSLDEPTHGIACGFDPAWCAEREIAQWAPLDSELRALLARTAHEATADRIPRIKKEGAVQTAFCSRLHAQLCVIDREANFHGHPSDYARVLAAASAGPYMAQRALAAERWARSTLRARIGGEVDALVIDQRGRLLTVEVKPSGVGAAAAPAQAVTYAAMFRAWADGVGVANARAVLHEMCTQRVELGLGTRQELATDFEVVPVIAVGVPEKAEAPSTVTETRRRLSLVLEQLEAQGAPPVELWRIHRDGQTEPFEL